MKEMTDITDLCRDRGEEVMLRGSDAIFMIISCFIASFIGAVLGIVAVWKFDN